MTFINKVLKGGAIAGFSHCALKYLEYLSSDNSTSIDFDYQRFYNFIKIGMVSGAAYSLISNKQDKFSSSCNKEIDSILSQKADSLTVNTNSSKFKAHIKLRDEIATNIENEFHCCLIKKPINIGSLEKGTAISSSYDADLALTFDHHSFSTLKEMHFSVHALLKRSFGNLYNIIIKSRGITIYKKNDMTKVDVIFGRQMPNLENESSEVNLYKSYCDKKKCSSRIKTNFDMQNQVLYDTKINIDNIKLLRSYLFKKKVKFPSYIIEHCSNTSLEKSSSNSPTELFIRSLKKLSSLLNQKKITDSLNQNNNLLEGIPRPLKTRVSKLILADIKNIQLESEELITLI